MDKKITRVIAIVLAVLLTGSVCSAALIAFL